MNSPYFTLILILSLSCATLSSAQQNDVKKEKGVTTDISIAVPPHIAPSAAAAVQKLGEKIKIGDFLYGYNTMYDRYRKRQEERHGAQKFKTEVLNAKNVMIKLAASIENYKTQNNALRPMGFFRVLPKIKPEIKAKLATGEIKQTKPGDEYYHWMVIVPTTQIWKFLSNTGAKPRYLKREGFQIAIAKETDLPGKEQWTFIGEVKEQELRSLFPSLPPNLELPKLKDSEIKTLQAPKLQN